VRRITGIQVHHSVNLEDASRFGANLLTALEAAYKKTGAEETKKLIDELTPLVRKVGVERTAAGMRLQMHQRDPEFKRYVEGDEPWPDELAEGFVARCRCHDKCLFHDMGRGSAEQDCNCGIPCGQHPEAEAA
jgi:hypothetical protein